VKTQSKLSVLRRQNIEKQKLESIMDMIMEGIVNTDELFGILQMNPGAAWMLDLREPQGSRDALLLGKYGRKYFNRKIAGGLSCFAALRTSSVT
jgi:hypothetical protein